MAIETVSSLQEALRESGLLEPNQLDELSRLAVRYADPRELARELMARAWLTPYQVNQLFQADGQSLVLGPYVLLEMLGSGGMGQVFKARHKLMKRIVALKVIRKDRLGDANSVTRFLREIEACGQLAHANIVTAYDANQVGDTLLFAMEYVEGTDLSRLVKENGALPIAQACAYARQTALALQHAHERGLVHRDIKPHNLLVSFLEGKVKVLDMGLARLHGAISDAETADGLTQTGAVMGTPDYISPEQARHARVDIRSDIYSLGCSLYYMLAGRVPFTAASLTEKLLHHQLDQPDSITKLRPEVSGNLAQVLARMMAKNPEERYQTPAEVADALEPFVAGRSTATMRMNGSGSTLNGFERPADLGQLVATTKESVRRHPRRYILGAASAIGLFLLILWLVQPTARSRIPPRERFSWQPEELYTVLGEHRLRHWTGIRQIAYSPDGKLLATCSTNQNDRSIRLWDAETRQEFGKLGDHDDEVTCIAFAGDNRILVSGSEDDSIKVWDIETSSEIRTLRGHEAQINSIAFDYDGRNFASAGRDGKVKLWAVNLSTPRHTFEVKGYAVSVAYSPKGLLAAAVQPTDAKKAPYIQLWRLDRMEEAGIVEVAKGTIQKIAINRTGRYLAYGHSTGNVKIWDLTSKQEHATVGAYNNNCLAFGPNPNLLAIGGAEGQNQISAGEVLLWNVTTGEQIARLAGSMRQITSVAFCPDRKTLATGSIDGLLQLWDLPKQEERSPKQGSRYAVRCVCFTTDGQSIACGLEDGALKLWDLKTLQSRDAPSTHRRAIHAMAVSHDGRTLASGGAGGIDESIYLWQLDKLQVRVTMPGFRYVRALAFSEDDSRLGVGYDAGAQIRDVATRRQLIHVNQGASSAVALASDLTRAAINKDRKVKLWDLESGKEILTFENASPYGPLAFSPDGAVLASGSYSNQTGVSIKLWDVETGLEKHNLTGHGGYIRALAFHPDGNFLVSSDTAGNVVFWNPRTGEELRKWRILGGVNCFAFSPDRKLLASANSNGTVYVYRLEE